MSKEIITSDVANEFVTKASEKKYILSRDYKEAENEELDALFPAFDELSMARWMLANCKDYATTTEVPNEFYLEAATHKVTSFNTAFAGCAALASIHQVNTRNVTDFMFMFQGCTSLPSVFEFVFQCDSITELSHMTNIFKGSSVKTARFENLDPHIAASLISDPSQLGDLDAAIINGYYIKVVKAS